MGELISNITFDEKIIKVKVLLTNNETNLFGTD